MVPALMLRIHRDQICYDFMKWSAPARSIECPDGTIDDMPFFVVKAANAFESIECLLGSSSYHDPGHLIAITLLKIEVLIEVVALRESASVCQDVTGKVHLEIQR
jgi:hypothetical protein